MFIYEYLRFCDRRNERLGEAESEMSERGEREGISVSSQIFSDIYAWTSENLFFIALRCGAANAQKISTSIRRQPSSVAHATKE